MSRELAQEIATEYAGKVVRILPQKTPAPAGVTFIATPGGQVYEARVVAWKDSDKAWLAVELLTGQAEHTGLAFKKANNWTWVVDQTDYASKVVMRLKPEDVVLPEDTAPKADWEVMLSVMCPTIKRPRRTSLHTLATVLGRPDPLALAEEMRKSRKVLGYVCPDVKTPIFYLKSLCRHPGMIDTRDANVWSKLPDFFQANPYPKIKGFKRFASPTWTGGSYGKGKCVVNSAMEVPYESGDYPYAKEVLKTLRAAGFTPGIDESILK